jgi:hypothetical protein
MAKTLNTGGNERQTVVNWQRCDAHMSDAVSGFGIEQVNGGCSLSLLQTSVARDIELFAAIGMAGGVLGKWWAAM